MLRNGDCNCGDILVAIARDECHVSVRCVVPDAYLQSLPLFGVCFAKNVLIKRIFKAQSVNRGAWNDPIGVPNSTVSSPSVEFDINSLLELLLHCARELSCIVGDEPMLFFGPEADIVIGKAIWLDFNRIAVSGGHMREFYCE